MMKGEMLWSRGRKDNKEGNTLIINHLNKKDGNEKQEKRTD